MTLRAYISSRDIWRSLAGDVVVIAALTVVGLGLIAWDPSRWLQIPLLAVCALLWCLQSASFARKVRRSVRKNPVIEIGDSGVTFATTGEQSHTIAWDAIAQVKCPSSKDADEQFEITCLPPRATVGTQSAPYRISARYLTQTVDDIWSAFKAHLPSSRLDSNLLNYKTPIRHIETDSGEASESGYTLGDAADKAWDNLLEGGSSDSAGSSASVHSGSGGNFGGGGATGRW